MQNHTFLNFITRVHTRCIKLVLIFFIFVEKNKGGRFLFTGINGVGPGQTFFPDSLIEASEKEGN